MYGPKEIKSLHRRVKWQHMQICGRYTSIKEKKIQVTNGMCARVRIWEDFFFPIRLDRCVVRVRVSSENNSVRASERARARVRYEFIEIRCALALFCHMDKLIILFFFFLLHIFCTSRRVLDAFMWFHRASSVCTAAAASGRVVACIVFGLYCCKLAYWLHSDLGNGTRVHHTANSDEPPAIWISNKYYSQSLRFYICVVWQRKQQQ